MDRPALQVEENNNILPVLLVDKTGVIGKSIISKLASLIPLVFVSSKKIPSQENVVFIHYARKAPKIPDVSFSRIIFIEEETSLKKIYPSLLKKAVNERIELVYVKSIFDSSNQDLDRLENSYEKLKTVIYGDIFKENIQNTHSSPVNKFLEEAFLQGFVRLDNDGTGKVFPVFIDDVVLGIIEASFGNRRNRRFFAFPKHTITQLSLARAIQKAYPDTTIDFGKTKKEIPDISLENGDYVLEENYNLSQKIKFVSPALDKKRISRGKLEKPFFLKNLTSFLLVFIFLLLIFPFLISFAGTILGLSSVKLSLVSLEKGNSEYALKGSTLATGFFRIAQIGTPPLVLEASLVGQKERGLDFSDKITSLEKGANSISGILIAGKALEAVLSGESKDTYKDFSTFQTNLKKSLVGIETLRSSSLLSSSQKEALDSLSPFLNTISASLDISPEILGISSERKYLVLFQNNAELRPGGGFIGSYGILTLKNGQIQDFLIDDVYNADGQLKGHVEPPFPIRRYLPSPHWYLRDSNFDVDFRGSASSAAYFLSLERKENVDGVIAIDTSFVKKLISILGSVEVPEYNVLVTSENFVSLTQEKAQKDFFPGSTQKKDFLGSLFRAIEERFSQRRNVSYLNLARELTASVKEKHLLFYFADSSIQDIFTIGGWSSSIWDERASGKNVINDFFGLNEANLGVNKANLYIERQVSNKLSIAENGQVVEESEITFTNSGKEDYKNYLRIILPLNSYLTSISVNNVLQTIVNPVIDPNIYEATGFSSPAGLEVERSERGGKSVFGFLNIVPAGKSVKIKVNYELPVNVFFDGTPISYSGKIFKQPGVDDYQFSFDASYPMSLLNFQEGNGGIRKEADFVSFRNTVREDVSFSFLLGQN